jgi:hypothetical protein
MISEEEYVATMARGTAAAALLADPTLNEALDQLQDDLTESWRTSPLMARDTREMIYAEVRGVEAIRSKLRAWADAAKKTSHDVQRRQGR